MSAVLALFRAYRRFSKIVLLSLPLLLSGFLVHPAASLSPVTISIGCTPNGMMVSQTTTCSATLTDTSIGPTPPAGFVSWNDAGAAGGGFFDLMGSCPLQPSGPDSSSCTITYTAPSISNSSLAIIGTWSDFTNGYVQSYTFISVLPPIVTSGLSATTISVDETTRNTIITLTNSSGATVGQVLLPQGSYFPPASTFTISYDSGGGVSRLQVSGVVVPYGSGKTLLIASSASDVCIVDSSTGVSFNAPPDCSSTNVSQSSQVVLPCDGLPQTFGGSLQPKFPEAPNPRTYTCTPSNGFLRVDGLAYSFIETLELPPVMTIGTSTSLTSDVSARIVIGADDVTLNCNGHTIRGVTASSSSPSNNGITLNGRKGVTIENCRIVRFNVGIQMIGSTANLIVQNTASGNGYGFVLSSSNFNALVGNTANGNVHDGFRLISSNNNALLRNVANNNGGYGFALISSNNNLVRSNAACGNGLFDGYQETSSGNKFTKNVFCSTKNI